MKADEGFYVQDIDLRDRLSGLLNRRAGEQRLSAFSAYAYQKKIPFITIMIDINDLNEINQLHGHDQGDQLLVKVAARIRSHLRNDEFAMRFSGDEIFIVLPDCRKSEAYARMQHLLDELEEDSATLPYDISFCYGIVEITPDSEKSSTKIIMETDDEMYQWKRRYHLEKSRKIYEANAYRESEEVRSFTYDSTHLLSALMQSTDDYIYVCNLQEDPSTFRYSKAMVEDFALPQEIIHDAANVWGSRIHEADQRVFMEGNQEIADGRTDFHNVEYRALNKNNEWVWLRCRGHVERDLNGNPVLFAGIITDLGRKSKIDHLTGLFNKYELEETMQQLIKKEEPFSMIMMDLDDFSNINKLYNHHYGDAVLSKMAQQLQSILPEQARLYRNDGDEFIVLCKGEDQEYVEKLYAIIQKEVDHQQILQGERYHCTLSAGAAFYPKDASDLMTLTKAAGYALENSKRSGKNRLTFFEKQMLQKEIRELDLIEQLRYSVEHDYEGFTLYYQPQVQAEDGHIIGVEALARWQCDMYGNVPPLTFIPLLEQSGMIIPVGKWIFQEALRQCRTWIDKDPDFTVSINLSYLQVCEQDFPAFMKQSLHDYGIQAKNVIVEMTESYLIKDDEVIHQVFKEIRELGIRIAMDDFGTGYSSLGVLKNAPADIVKIDKIFMKDVLTSNFDATFIHFVVRLCHDVGIEVLLEGVETLDEYQKVKEMGLDYIQGYYFGKPIPKEEWKL